MAEGDAPAGGGPQNGNFNHVNVNTARVGTVLVERLDSRTGGPRDGSNELVDQIKILGDRLETSLSAMLDQLKDIKKADDKTVREETRDNARSQTREQKQDKDDSKTQDKILAALESMAKMMAASEKAAEKRNEELVDSVHQQTSGVHKDITAGLKQYVSAHRTVIRELMQQMRQGAHSKLGSSYDRHEKRREKRNSEYYAKGGFTGKLNDKTKALAERSMSLKNKIRRGAGHISDSAMTYGYQKYTEDSHSGAERWATQLDRSVGSLISFNNTIDYATKKWKQYTDMSGSGVGNAYDAFISDFTKLGVAGDSLGETFEMLRRSVKAGFETNDSQIFIANKSLQEASASIRELRKGTQKAGFDTNAFMGFRDANEVLGDILTQLKRAGIMDGMNQDQQTRYLADQLKMAQLVAENTGLTVKEVIKMNNENSKKSAEFVAAGMLKPGQKGGYDAAMSRLSANKPLQSMIQQMVASGSFEQFMAADQNRARGLVASGVDQDFRNAYDAIQRGGDPDKVGNEVFEALQRAKGNAAGRTQDNGAAVSGKIMTGDMPAVLASLNQLTPYGAKNAPGTGNSGMSSVNAVEDFFANKLPWDALKALLGIPALLLSANVLLGTIAINTGGLGGVKSMIKGALTSGGGGLKGMIKGAIGLGGAEAAAGAAGLGAGTAAAGAGAAAGGAGILGGLGGALKTAGKFALKGAPIIGGLAGGAVDRAAGGSLLEAILTGAGSGAAIGGIGGLAAGGVGAIPGALLGGLGGAITGGIGYGLADTFMGPKTPETGVAPTPPSYSTSSTDNMAILGRGMYSRMDTQIEKLDELIKVMKDKNVGAKASQTTVNQAPGPGSGASEPGSWLGNIAKLWG